MRGKLHGPSIDIIKIANRLCDRAEFEIERYCLAVGFRFDDLAAAYASAATERFGSILHSPRERSVRGEVQSMRVETTEIHQVELPALEGSRHSQDAGDALEASAQVQGDRREKVTRGRPTGQWDNWHKLSDAEKLEKSIVRLKKRSDPVGKRMLQGALAKRRALKSSAAVKGTVKEMKTKQKDAAAELKRKAKDAERHRKLRAARKQGLHMSDRPTKPGTLGHNGKPVLTAEQRAAKQKIYVQRSMLRAQGVPESELPKLPGQEVNSAAVQ